MADPIIATKGAALPVWTILWPEVDPDALEAGDSWTFEVRCALATGGANISVDVTADVVSGGTVTVTPAQGWDDVLDPTRYIIEVWPTRESDSKQHEPHRMTLVLQEPIS